MPGHRTEAADSGWEPEKDYTWDDLSLEQDYVSLLAYDAPEYLDESEPVGLLSRAKSRVAQRKVPLYPESQPDISDYDDSFNRSHQSRSKWLRRVGKYIIVPAMVIDLSFGPADAMITSHESGIAAINPLNNYDRVKNYLTHIDSIPGVGFVIDHVF